MADDDWSDSDIQQLILEYKRRPILWNISSSDNINRREKIKAWKSLAEIFDATVSITQRKIQNLRSQFEAELKKNSKKKIGRRKKSINTVVWPYFESLQFINTAETQTEGVTKSPRTTSPIVEENIRTSHADLSTEEDTEVELSSEIQTRNSPETTRPLKRRKLYDHTPEKGDSLNYRNRPIARDWLSEYRSQSAARADVVEDQAESVITESSVSTHKMDDYDVFGAFVSSEIRNLKHEESKKKLKGMIQKCILQVVEEDGKKNLYPSLLGFHVNTGLSPVRRPIGTFNSGADRFNFSRYRSNLNFD